MMTKWWRHWNQIVSTVRSAEEYRGSVIFSPLNILKASMFANWYVACHHIHKKAMTLSAWAGTPRTSQGKATSDLPQSQNSQWKAAGSCQATLSLSQQEVESNRTLITFSSILQESLWSDPRARRRFHIIMVPVQNTTVSSSPKPWWDTTFPGGTFLLLIKHISEIEYHISPFLSPLLNFSAQGNQSK